MRKQSAKRGFTITELIIVIVVIAILAAVLIPTFASLIKKANRSADVQLVRSLNVIVAAEAALTNGEISAHGAILAAEENGYNIEKLTPTTEDRTIVWDGANYRFALLDENKKEIFPKDSKSGTPAANLFVISNTYPAEGFDGYAVYLTDGCTLTEVTTTAGVDVGNNDQITKITYTGTEEVAVRGAKYTTIIVQSGTVHHYDLAWTAYENGGTYVEHGTLNIPVQTGAYVDTGFAGGEGTESNPYIIANIDNWNNLAATADTNGDKHIVIGADMVFDANTQTISTFGGTLDFQNHTVTCTADMPSLNLIGTAEDGATIKNVKINNAKDNFSMVYSSEKDVTFENVTVTGNYATSGNNQGALISYPGLYSEETEFRITLENCNNYANITNSNSYAGLFIGTFNYLPKNTTAYVTIKDCANYGTLIGKNSAMIVSASASGNGNNAATVKMYIENVRNYGAIIGSEHAGLIMSKAALAGCYEYVEPGLLRGKVLFYSDESFADQYLITDANGERVKLFEDETPAQLDVKNAGAGITKVGFETLTTDASGNLVLDNVINSDAVKYRVAFGWSGVHGKMNGGAYEYAFEINAADISTTNVKAYKWVNANTNGDDRALEATTLPTTTVTYGETTLKVDSQNRYVFSVEGSQIRQQPMVIVYAFDAEGNVVAMGSYTYPAN